METLKGKKVAILTDNGFEEEELMSPKRALEEAGARVWIVSLRKDEVNGWHQDHWSIKLSVDIDLEDANADDYDALMIPGGVFNPDQMRRHQEYIDFARRFLESGRVVAAICHAPQLLIETGLLRERDLTSFRSIKTDLINAGAYWHDQEVVTDNGIVTSRSLEDLPAFNKKMIEEIEEGIHRKRYVFASSSSL